MRQTFRSEDAIYRLGGDEFVVFVAEASDAEQSVCVMPQQLMTHVGTARVKFNPRSHILSPVI